MIKRSGFRARNSVLDHSCTYPSLAVLAAMPLSPPPPSPLPPPPSPTPSPPSPSPPSPQPPPSPAPPNPPPPSPQPPPPRTCPRPLSMKGIHGCWMLTFLNGCSFVLAAIVYRAVNVTSVIGCKTVGICNKAVTD
eukprot:429573-Pelagomonas_calceolata.AAC.2